MDFVFLVQEERRKKKRVRLRVPAPLEEEEKERQSNYPKEGGMRGQQHPRQANLKLGNLHTNVVFA